MTSFDIVNIDKDLQTVQDMISDVNIIILIYLFIKHVLFSGVIGRSHLIVKLLAICCYVNFGFSFA
jgi:hypothetical protein